MPAAKDIVVDMGTTAIELMIYGERRGTILPNRTGVPVAPATSKFNYNGITTGGGSRLISHQAQMAPSREDPRDRIIPNEIIVSSRAEAEAIVAKMDELIEKYTAVTLADVYRMIGRSIEYTDDKWGWRNLESAHIKRVGQGVLLVLPTLEALD